MLVDFSMKIGFFCTFFPEKPPFTETSGFGYGGADESLYDIVMQLHNFGHEIIIFSIGDSKKVQYESPSDGLELYRFPVIRIPFLSIPVPLKGFLSLKFLKLEKNFNLDVIHAKEGNPPGGLAAFNYKRKYGCPMILDIGGKQNTEWGSLFRKISMKIYLKLFYSKVLKGSDAIIVSSNEYLLDDTMLFPYKNKIDIVPKGLDFNFFSSCNNLPIENVPCINEIKKYNKIILYVGNLAESKGVHILIKAFEMIKNEHPDLLLLIAGKGPMQKKLQSIVKDLKLNDRVLFVGYLDKISLKKLYHIADLFVLPSMSEGFPRVILEALASGTPCLVSDIGANKGALRNGQVGFMAKCFDIKDFADKINYFFGHDDIWYKKESIKSKKYAAEFSWEKTAKKFETIYERLISKDKYN